jgi:hypothetical protein
MTMPEITRRQILAGAAATAAVAAMPGAANAAVQEAPAEAMKQAVTAAEREDALATIVGWLQNTGNGYRPPQSGILSFGGRRIFIIDPSFRNEAEMYLFGEAGDQWRLEDYHLTPDDIINRAGMSLAKVVDTRA